MNPATLRDEVLSLPALERARLVDLLWTSLSEPEVQAREIAWAGEAERRIDAYDAGSLPARGAQEVLAALQKHR